MVAKHQKLIRTAGYKGTHIQYARPYGIIVMQPLMTFFFG